MLYFVVSVEVARALDMRADVLASARWLSALATVARLAGMYTCDRNRDTLTTFLAVQAHGSGIDIEWRCTVGPQLEHWIPGSIQSIRTLSNAPGKFKLKATIHTGGAVFQMDLTELRWRCGQAEPSEQHPGQQTAPANSVQKAAAADGDAAAKKVSDPTAPQTPPNNKSTAPTAQSAGVTDVQCAQGTNAALSAACATLGHAGHCGTVLAAQSPCSDDSATELPELQTTQQAPAAPPATAKDADQSALDEPPDDRAPERQQGSRNGVTQELSTAAR